jgi:hypothetical protein
MHAFESAQELFVYRNLTCGISAPVCTKANVDVFTGLISYTETRVVRNILR